MLLSSRTFVALVVSACVAATALRAQGVVAGATALRPVRMSMDTVEATAGSRIRLGARTIQNPSLTGTLIAVRGDSLWFRYGLSPIRRDRWRGWNADRRDDQRTGALVPEPSRFFGAVTIAATEE